MLTVTATPNLYDAQGLMGYCADIDAENWAIGLGTTICFPKFQITFNSLGTVSFEGFHSLDPQKCTWFKVDPKLVKTLRSLKNTRQSLKEGKVTIGWIYPVNLNDRQRTLISTIRTALQGSFAKIPS